VSASVISVTKDFTQGPQNHYLMNSSALFVPTDYLTINSPVYDARHVVINKGMVGGLDSLVPSGTESIAFKDTSDGNYFYQIWHLAHIDTKHDRTNVVTIIVSLGGIQISSSGEIDESELIQRLLSNTNIEHDNDVYVQVYRTWSIPTTIPLTQSNMDGWWHSITHAFHDIVSVYDKYKTAITIAKVIYPILISLSDEQPGLGLKSLTYSPDPLVTDTPTAYDSSTTTTTSTNDAFTYALTPGEMSALVIFVFLAGVIGTLIYKKICSNNVTIRYNNKLTAGDIESSTPESSSNISPLI